MEGPRAPREQELNEVIQFLDHNLRKDQPWSISQEYPLAISSTNINNIRILRDEKGVVSSAIVKPLLVKTPAGIFRVAAIGSVVTSPNYRNLGHSHKILQSCLETAYAQGFDFAVLWTDLYEFYAKLGFELAGSEIAIEVDRPLQCETEGLKFVESSKISPEAISKLYSLHTTGTVRTVPDIQKHLQIPNARVYTAWNQQNQIQAYAIEGKGLDLGGYVHEWGGGVSKLLALFNHIYTQRQQSFRVIASAHSKNLLRQLEQQGLALHEGYLGMIKILDTENLLQKIKRYSRNMGVDDLVLEKRGNIFYIGTPGQMFTTDSERDLVKIIFGPHKASEIHNFDAHTTEVMEELFPVPLWIWGWDSV